MVADRNDDDLGNFFSRPIKIQSYSWAVGQTLFERFNPWQDYFENARVINRIANFGLMRATLHVKFVINGNGFHYGRLISSYIPRHTLDQFTKDRAFFPQDLVQASQRPHIYLDPTTSQGGSMCLPFFWEDNYLEVPDQEWREMGELTLQTLQTLQHANGATDVVSVNVFAWAEDVKLAIPTSSAPGALTPQMAEVTQDEYKKDGPVSTPASTIGRVAGMLGKAPVIGPYARATEMVAKTVASVAKIFGYSRPNNIADIQYFRPTVMGNLANTNVADTCQKLTVDAKQELTIDPRTTGLGEADELTIKSIATRESYLTQFNWRVDDPTETPLWQTEVTPMTWAVNDITTPPEMHVPACAFAAIPFRNWYGSMKYRFQIVSSNYHKGRIKIVYDPHGFASNEYNTNYTYIVDIAEDKDFTVQIGWGSDKAYCVVGIPGRFGVTDSLDIPYGDTVTGVVPGNRANGVLRVYVVNELTTPNTTITNDVSINVFVSAGDDIQFRNPTAALDQFSYFDERTISAESTDYARFQDEFGDLLDERRADPHRRRVYDPQMAEATSGHTPGDTEDTMEPSKPMAQAVDETMLNPVSTTDQYSKVFYGEEIVSFRQMLKRYCLHYTDAARFSTGDGTWKTIWNAFPFHKGYAPGGITGTFLPVVAVYNYSKMTYLNYLTPAFTGRRGGIKWKINAISGAGNSQGTMIVSRLDDPERYSSDVIDTEGATRGGLIRSYDANLQSLSGGAAVTNTQVIPTVEIEAPYQQNLRFSPAKRANFTTDTTYSDHLVHDKITNFAAGDELQKTQYFCAAGEDFNLFFFTGAPIMYWNVELPIAL